MTCNLTMTINSHMRGVLSQSLCAGALSASPSQAPSGGYSAYESDFEDFTPDQETMNARCKILSSLQELERSGEEDTSQQPGFPGAAPVVQVEERVRADVFSSKAAAMRERCQEALGFHFPQVYAYLRRIRTQEHGAGTH